MPPRFTPDARALKRAAQPDSAPGPYVLIARGPDGRPRREYFNDAATYRARLAELTFSYDSLSIEEVAGLLDS